MDNDHDEIKISELSSDVLIHTRPQCGFDFEFRPFENSRKAESRSAPGGGFIA